MEDLLADYEKNHESLVCRASHAVGIPLIMFSIPMLLFKPKTALKMFVLGWALQFLGHAAEGKKPKFFEGSRYLLAGAVWWLRLVSKPVRSQA